MPTNSPVMGITVGTWKRGGVSWRTCRFRCWSANSACTTWRSTGQSSRNSSVFGWIWIKTCSLAAACAKACASLRERWRAILGSSVGLRTINERINQIEPLLEQAHQEPITDVPTVVQFDGIWVTIQRQTETIKVDKRQRRRHQRSGKQVVILVALGFWNDGSGRREVLDWQIATSQEHTERETMLHRLWQWGLRPEKGLQMVVRDGSGGLGEALALVYGSQVIEQRCLFHKLRNVTDNCRSEFKGEQKREEKKQFLEQARAVYQAERAEEAKRRLVPG